MQADAASSRLPAHAGHGTRSAHAVLQIRPNFGEDWAAVSLWLCSVTALALACIQNDSRYAADDARYTYRSKYLHRYLTWHILHERIARLRPRAARRVLLGTRQN